MANTVLRIIHWNDVYRVAPQKLSYRSPETIDVTQFGALLDDIRGQWPDREDGGKDGLVLFSGDVFSPSVESSVTRGSHMVPIMNEIGPDVSLTGNHDFDFGYPHLCKLIQDTTFPWILSNIIDNITNQVPEHLHEYEVFERAGTRIGIIGLVEKEWIGTVASWPSNFEYRDMEQIGRDLSKRLRDPQGEHCCDIIIALTHSRVPNDLSLAKGLLALSPAEQERNSVAAAHGVDLLLGGHDHLYYVSRGVSSWEGYDTNQEVLGAEPDQGDVLVIKSGTDFRDLSELTLELVDTPPGSARRKVIKHISGKRHTTKPDYRSSEKLKELLKELLSSVSSSLKSPVCKTTTEIDVRSELIRTTESAAGNWFADVLRHTYDDALCMKGRDGSDGVFICAGTLRGDSIYSGTITLGDILEILPFEDPLVVLELDGEAVWAALEASLETWPAQEGRFPVVSGFHVSWDSRRSPGQRVLGVWLLKETPRNSESLEDGPEIKREKGGRKYNIVTREYMAQGHDGFLPLKGQKYLIDDETGQIMSSVVRKYLMGSHYVNEMMRLANERNVQHRHADTDEAISRERDRRQTRAQWKQTAALAVRSVRSKSHYRDQINVSSREDMNGIDCFNGAKARRGKAAEPREEPEDLPVVYPIIDGRLKDEGRA